MNTENLGELFAAMAAARLEFGEFTKSKTANMGTYTYSYADLSDIIEATAPALAKHGLVIIQEPELVSEGGQTLVVVSGCIGHKSGGIYPLKPLSLPVASKTAQAVGSAISYARRYQLGAFLNLAASDDDGESAQESVKTPQKAAAPRKDADANAVPTDAELTILGTWQSPQDAQKWALEQGSCKNEFEAKQSFKNVVDEHGGRLTKENVALVYLLFLRKHMDKLQKAA